jgi:hypothetical protein
MNYIASKHRRAVIETLSALVARSPEVVEGNSDYAAFLQGAEPMLRELRAFFVTLDAGPNIAPPTANGAEFASGGGRHECS